MTVKKIRKLLDPISDAKIILEHLGNETVLYEGFIGDIPKHLLKLELLKKESIYVEVKNTVPTWFLYVKT